MVQLVFSSSATVYGWPKEVPCTEEFDLCAMNPYGRTKVSFSRLFISSYFHLSSHFRVDLSTASANEICHGLPAAFH